MVICEFQFRVFKYLCSVWGLYLNKRKKEWSVVCVFCLVGETVRGFTVEWQMEKLRQSGNTRCLLCLIHSKGSLAPEKDDKQRQNGVHTFMAKSLGSDWIFSFWKVWALLLIFVWSKPNWLTPTSFCAGLQVASLPAISAWVAETESQRSVFKCA